MRVSNFIVGVYFIQTFLIAHVRYILKILTWLRVVRDKIANFSRLHCLSIPERDLSAIQIKSKPNTEIRPESLGVIILAEFHAREAEHHGLENLVIYPSEKFW